MCELEFEHYLLYIFTFQRNSKMLQWKQQLNHCVLVVTLTGLQKFTTVYSITVHSMLLIRALKSIRASTSGQVTEPTPVRHGKQLLCPALSYTNILSMLCYIPNMAHQSPLRGWLFKLSVLHNVALCLIVRVHVSHQKCPTAFIQ